MLLRVDLPEGPFLADVGFGGDGPVHPLPVAAGAETWIADAGYRLRREDEPVGAEGTLAGEWTDLYAFTLEPQYPVDFEMANHFTSTYPRSPFVQTLTAQRSWPDGAPSCATATSSAARRRRADRDDPRSRAPARVLDREFGLSFPRAPASAGPSSSSTPPGAGATRWRGGRRGGRPAGG